MTGRARLLLPIAALSVLACALPVNHGYVELDENTDPTFHKQAEPGARIATYESRGRVLVNGTPVSGSGSLENGAHVSTGPGGWIRIGLSGKLSQRCEQGVEISRFDRGNLYGERRKCDLRVSTGFGTITAASDAAHFLVSVTRSEGEVTVVRGSVSVARSDAPRGIVVPERHEIRLSRDRFTRPQAVPEEVILQRLRWVSTSVPSVSDLTTDSARVALQKAGLRLGKVGTQTNTEDKRPGVISSQKPPAYDRVQRGTVVDVWVWGASTYVNAPNLVGKTLSQARTELARQKLQIGKVTEVKGRAAESDAKVTLQQPPPGTRVEPSRRFDLTVENPATVLVY